MRKMMETEMMMIIRTEEFIAICTYPSMALNFTRNTSPIKKDFQKKRIFLENCSISFCISCEMP
jgi:hypothetical protein